jgi:hypothetical protein
MRARMGHAAARAEARAVGLWVEPAVGEWAERVAGE